MEDGRSGMILLLFPLPFVFHHRQIAYLRAGIKIWGIFGKGVTPQIFEQMTERINEIIM